MVRILHRRAHGGTPRRASCAPTHAAEHSGCAATATARHGPSPGGDRTMKAHITRWLTAGALAVAASTMFLPNAQAACGCDKPPPPRAAVRPFVGHADQQIALFDDRLVQNARYTVLFESRDGSQDWRRGKAAMKRDFAD